MYIKAKDDLPMIEPVDICCEEPEGGVDETLPPVSSLEGKKSTTMKNVVWICLLNGIAWVWCSYILAWLGKEQIAESLSQVALAEIIGVVLVYAVKALFENLSKNNVWPDKAGSKLSYLPEEKKFTTMKKIVAVCLLNGIAWVWCSYLLAWQGKEQIAESLSQVALTEIIGVVLVYAAKSLFENLSKNNSWPDKTESDPPDGVG